MTRFLRLLVPVLLLIGPPDLEALQGGSAQTPTFQDHLDVQIGFGLLGASVYRRAATPTAPKYRLRIKTLVDPLIGLRGELAAGIHSIDHSSLSVFVTASTLERNRFYGYGNDTSPSLPGAYYQLDQLIIETGFEFRRQLGPSHNFISLRPVFRLTRTGTDQTVDRLDDDVDVHDDGGVIAELQPYGVGAFRQTGLVFESQISTTGQRGTGHFGIRVGLSAAVYPRALDVVSPFGSVRLDTKSFLNLPVPTDPEIVFTTTIHRVIGTAPFHDAAYLGGRRTLRGFKKQQLAGDLALRGTVEVYPKAGTVTLRQRLVTIGPMLLADIGRVYVNGDSPGSWNTGVGGGIWFRDDDSWRQVTISMARGAFGPRAYVALGTPFWH